MSDDGLFGVICEWKQQGPLLMEMEGQVSSREAAFDQMKRLTGNPNVLRVCVVRLEHVDGNELLIADMKRMQK